jgi:hypothetical protein
MSLCEQASTEKDSERLLSLVSEINELLQADEQRACDRLNGQAQDGTPSKRTVAEARERIASSNENIRASNQAIGYTRRIVGGTEGQRLARRSR